MHYKGYLYEACIKEQGSGGFHIVVNKVMKRPKLTSEVFKKVKFETENENRIKEAVRDGARAYCAAAVMEFANTECYPNCNDISRALGKYGNHNDILYDAFLK